MIRVVILWYVGYIAISAAEGPKSLPVLARSIEESGSGIRALDASATNLTVSTRSLLASFPRKREPRATKTPCAALDPRFPH